MKKSLLSIVLTALMSLVLLAACGNSKGTFTVSDGHFDLSPAEFVALVNQYIDGNEYGLLPTEEAGIKEKDGNQAYYYQANDSLQLYLVVNDDATKISSIQMFMPYAHPLFKDTVGPAMYYMGLITGLSNTNLDERAFSREIDFDVTHDSFGEYTQNGVYYNWYSRDLTVLYEIRPA